jgi:antitoxin (DNA-binding transcriptional repressor) of toxin-antitoxin stability system
MPPILSNYGRICHREPVVITVNGKPSFHLVPLEQGDDLIDRLLADHPGFRRLLEARLREPIVRAAVLTKRLGARRAQLTQKAK